MCVRADNLPSAAWMEMRAVTRPRATWRVDGVAHRRFEHFQFARQVHGNFRLPAVHRAEFHGDFEAVPRALAAPVARHGFHWGEYAKIPRGRRINFPFSEGRALQAPKFQGLLELAPPMINQTGRGENGGLAFDAWIYRADLPTVRNGDKS